ncbi:MAG: TIGR01777 family oxidoreductase [Flavobacteriaceae bacterium]
MKLLIAGATGLIGKALVAECREAGIEVHYLTTQKEKIEEKEGCRGFFWNPKKGILDAEALEGVSAIINLAGASITKRWTSRYKKVLLQSRIETARALHQALQQNRHQVLHYISASGISIYPSSLVQLYHENETAISEHFLGAVVVQWEAAADAFEGLGIKVTKVRTGIVLSKDDGALPKMLKPIKMGLGAALGTGEQWQSWIHISDIAGIYLHLLQYQLEGVFNAVSPNPVTNKKMTLLLAQQYQKNIWLPNIPKWFLRLILGEMADIALESQLVASEKLLDAGYRFHFVNLENALEDLLG